MLGVSRTTKGDRMVAFEFLRIAEVGMLGRDIQVVSRSVRLQLRIVRFLARCQLKRPGQHGQIFGIGMPVRRELITVRETESQRVRPGSLGVLRRLPLSLSAQIQPVSPTAPQR